MGYGVPPTYDYRILNVVFTVALYFYDYENNNLQPAVLSPVILAEFNESIKFSTTFQESTQSLTFSSYFSVWDEMQSWKFNIAPLSQSFNSKQVKYEAFVVNSLYRQILISK